MGDGKFGMQPDRFVQISFRLVEFSLYKVSPGRKTQEVCVSWEFL